jgi:hypothetical protein
MQDTFFTSSGVRLSDRFTGKRRAALLLRTNVFIPIALASVLALATAIVCDAWRRLVHRRPEESR